MLRVVRLRLAFCAPSESTGKKRSTSSRRLIVLKVIGMCLPTWSFLVKRRRHVGK